MAHRYAHTFRPPELITVDKHCHEFFYIPTNEKVELPFLNQKQNTLTKSKMLFGLNFQAAAADCYFCEV